MKLILAGRLGHGFEELRRKLNSAKDIVPWGPSPSLPESVRFYRSRTAVAVPSCREGLCPRIRIVLYE